MKTIQLQLKVLGWPKHFSIIKNVLVTCKNEDDSITNKGARVAKTFPHYNNVLVTCKNEDNTIINKGARVAKTFPHYKECPRHLQ